MNRPRRTEGGPGAGGVSANGKGILLLVIAFILGIGILKSTEDSAPSIPQVSTGGTTVTTRSSHTSTPETTTTSAAPRDKSEVIVEPVNASGIVGLGGKTGDKLREAGYTKTKDAVNVVSAASSTPLTASLVEYAPGVASGPSDALGVAQALGLKPTAVKPFENPPVEKLTGIDVIVLIGTDLPTLVGETTTTAG